MSNAAGRGGVHLPLTATLQKKKKKKKKKKKTPERDPDLMTPTWPTARGFAPLLLAVLPVGRGRVRVTVGGPCRSSSSLFFARPATQIAQTSLVIRAARACHEGNDIMAPRHALALAAEAGTV